MNDDERKQLWTAAAVATLAAAPDAIEKADLALAALHEAELQRKSKAEVTHG